MKIYLDNKMDGLISEGESQGSGKQQDGTRVATQQNNTMKSSRVYVC